MSRGEADPRYERKAGMATEAQRRGERREGNGNGSCDGNGNGYCYCYWNGYCCGYCWVRKKRRRIFSAD
jgi:hypothetical protein